jgi:hypothetical protein
MVCCARTRRNRGDGKDRWGKQKEQAKVAAWVAVLRTECRVIRGLSRKPAGRARPSAPSGHGVRQGPRGASGRFRHARVFSAGVPGTCRRLFRCPCQPGTMSPSARPGPRLVDDVSPLPVCTVPGSRTLLHQASGRPLHRSRGRM